MLSVASLHRIALSIESVQTVLTELASLHATGFYFYATHAGGEDQLEKDHPYLFTKKFLGGTTDKVCLFSKLDMGREDFYSFWEYNSTNAELSVH
jgi:hypothetical protein